MALPEENTEKKRGNPFWEKGKSANPAGRPRVINPEKKTNKEIKAETLLHLVRKFRPHLTKAINAAVEILDNKESAESSKLRASALIIQTYRELVKDVYSIDEDEGEEIQESNKMPSFSLHVLKNTEE